MQLDDYFVHSFFFFLNSGGWGELGKGPFRMTAKSTGRQSIFRTPENSLLHVRRASRAKCILKIFLQTSPGTEV
jgi:hypothetical protein